MAINYSTRNKSEILYTVIESVSSHDLCWRGRWRLGLVYGFVCKDYDDGLCWLVASLVLERIANLVNEKATSSVNEEATSSVNEEVASLVDEEAVSSVDEEAASLVDEEAVNPVVLQQFY
ncbi:hypothetical protein Tco_1064591 [Tanacetum coccineum]